MLADPLFSNSRRYPNLLRHVVEATLAGHAEQLKERNLGIEVFGRDPDYDTSLEPIVRTTAVEIRKRLAQHYQERGRDAEIHIELPAGSYIPEFRKVEPAPQAAPVATIPVAPVAEPGLAATEPAKFSSYRLAAVAAVAILAIAAIVFARLGPAVTKPALDRFWEPVLKSQGPVVFCIGGTRAEGPAALPGEATVLQPPPPETPAFQVLRAETVALADSTSLSRISGLMERKGKNYQVRFHATTSFADLRATPVVLIGAFNNAWTMRFTEPLRFTFQLERNQGPEGKDVVDSIHDRQNPGGDKWTLNTEVAYSKVTQDYAIISRFYDQDTQGYIVSAGGLLKWGTAAAGEFLSDPRYMEEVAKQLPTGWDRKNIQIVIGTKVFNGNSGPPQVLAVHVW